MTRCCYDNLFVNLKSRCSKCMVSIKQASPKLTRLSSSPQEAIVYEALEQLNHSLEMLYDNISSNSEGRSKARTAYPRSNLHIQRIPYGIKCSWLACALLRETAEFSKNNDVWDRIKE